MTVSDAMARLRPLGNASVRKLDVREGAGENQFGVKLGDIRNLAKEIKTDPGLAAELWATGNLDAMLLATLIMRPKEIPAAELDRMVRSVNNAQLADWLTSYVVKVHPDKEALRQQWMQSDDPMAARAGWSLTADRIGKDAAGLDLASLLDRIESEMAGAHPMPQWTMNFCLGGIGIHHPEYRARAIEIGERLGVYRDYPVSKGCTSPFVPIWIEAIVGRQ